MIIRIIMEKNKEFLIIILVLLCIMGIANLLVNMQATNYQIITIDEVKMEVPYSNTTISNKTGHYTEYNDTYNGVYVYVFDSSGSSLIDAPEMFQFIVIRDVNQLESITYNEENTTYNYSSSLNEYTYLDNNMHKSVFIITKNEEDIMHIIQSLNYDNVKINNNTNNSQEKIVEKVVNSHPKI